MTSDDVSRILERLRPGLDSGSARVQEAFWDLDVAFNAWRVHKSADSWQKVERRAHAALKLAPGAEK